MGEPLGQKQIQLYEAVVFERGRENSNLDAEGEITERRLG